MLAPRCDHRVTGGVENADFIAGQREWKGLDMVILMDFPPDNGRPEDFLGCRVVQNRTQILLRVGNDRYRRHGGSSSHPTLKRLALPAWEFRYWISPRFAEFRYTLPLKRVRDCYES